MISKSFYLLKKNPFLVLFYAIYIAITFVLVLLLYPRDFSQFSDPQNYMNFDYIAYAIIMLKMLIAAGLMFLISLFFTAGYGFMITEAVTTGETSAASFLQGIKKFFVRILLLMLLLIAIVIGISIIIGIISIPLAFAMVMVGDPFIMSVIIYIVTIALVFFSVPFFILWIPAVFIDDTRIMKGLTNGLKAGVKNYWKLLLLLFFMYVPIVIYMLFNINTMYSGQIFSAGYFLLLSIEALISIIYLPIVFNIYHNYRQSLIANHQINYMP